MSVVGPLSIFGRLPVNLNPTNDISLLHAFLRNPVAKLLVLVVIPFFRYTSIEYMLQSLSKRHRRDTCSELVRSWKFTFTSKFP